MVDDTYPSVLSNGVVWSIPSLTLTDVLYVPRFLVSLLSINQFTKHNNCKIIFSPSHCVFQDNRLERGLVRGMSEEAYII